MKYAGVCEIYEEVTLFGFEGAGNKRTIWPVGQAVKTAASHAANMGSIPVRVTKVSVD